MQPLEMLLAPELQQARKRRRNWLAIAGCVFTGACVVVVEYSTLHEWVQGIRSRRMAAKAEAEILGGNLEEAVIKARAAYQTKPEEPAAIRIAAKVQRLVGQSSAAVPLWKQLAEIGAMRPEDRRPYAEDLLMCGATAEAGSEIEELLKDSAPDAAVYRLAARWSATAGNAEAARDFAGKAVRLEPENQDGRLLEALLQLSAGTEPLRGEAIRALLDLGKEPTREGLDALKQLGTLRGISLEVAARVRVLLEQHPLAAVQHRILAFSIDLALHPERKAEMLDAAVQQYRKADPAARCAFGNWLQARGEYDRILAVIPVDEAFKRQDLLRVSLDALAGLKRWQEIERILEMKDVPLYGAIKELYLARVAEELGKSSVAELHWRRAHLAAAPAPDMMREIAEYAERYGNLQQAGIAYRSLSVSANNARPGMEGLLRVARNRGDIAMLCDTLEKMHARWPHDASVQNDLAYFNLLRGREVDKSLAAAKDLVARSPRSLPHLTTLALAILRQQDPAAALAVYEGFQISWEKTPTSQRAVHAAVLGANGRTAEAIGEASALRWEELRPEERELIKPWRQQ